MDKSPFIYGTTVSEFSFTNREQAIEKLEKNLKGGINTILLSPRRWGKSSLVEKVAYKISENKNDFRIAVIDLFSVSSEAEFLELYAREVIKHSSSKWEEWVSSTKKLFKKIVPQIHISPDPYSDFSISFNWQELQKHSDEILNLPENIAKQKKLQYIICIDEFQNLASFPNFKEFEKKLRASFQRHKSVTYCLYGSKRHMMTDIFDNPSKPFYRFGDIMVLPKIERNKWVDFIFKNFKRTNKEISIKNAGVIADVMQNHSWYVQQLSHYTWNLSNKQATKREIQTALNEVINANTPLYQREIECLSSTQINFLKAVASKETKMTSTNVMTKYRLGTPRNVSKNKNILINNDIVEFSSEKYEFLDPAFELWFRKNFLNQSYNI